MHSIPQLRPETTTTEADARMTKEQLGELAEALSILSAKSSIVKERDELKQLMEHNITSEEVSLIVRQLNDSGLTCDSAGIQTSSRGDGVPSNFAQQAYP